MSVGAQIRALDSKSESLCNDVNQLTLHLTETIKAMRFVMQGQAAQLEHNRVMADALASHIRQACGENTNTTYLVHIALMPLRSRLDLVEQQLHSATVGNLIWSLFTAPARIVGWAMARPLRSWLCQGTAAPTGPPRSDARS